MRELTTLAQWRQAANEARAGGSRVGLVPTMGALHAGHVSLMTAARAACDTVFVTIFVNPRQFSNDEDLARYPRTLAADLDACASAGADVVVLPTLEEMWPDGTHTATSVTMRGVAVHFEGAQRPGHFDGVASVVAKLFNLTGECVAFFGEKDYQQLAVVRQMVRDLAIPVDVRGCPIVRDNDGLALSSRNVRLSDYGRREALALSRAVLALGDGRVRTVREAKEEMDLALATSDLEVAYAEIVDPVTLDVLSEYAKGPARALVAGIVEGVRLLDNGALTVGPSKGDHRATGH